MATRSERGAAPRAAKARGDIRIGISGWRYAPWRGRFCPRGLVQKKELACADAALASPVAAHLARRLGLRTGLGGDDRFVGIDETDGIELPATSYKTA